MRTASISVQRDEREERKSRGRRESDDERTRRGEEEEEEPEGEDRGDRGGSREKIRKRRVVETGVLGQLAHWCTVVHDVCTVAMLNTPTFASRVEHLHTCCRGHTRRLR